MYVGVPGASPLGLWLCIRRELPATTISADVAALLGPRHHLQCADLARLRVAIAYSAAINLEAGAQWKSCSADLGSVARQRGFAVSRTIDDCIAPPDVVRPHIQSTTLSLVLPVEHRIASRIAYIPVYR